MTAVSPQLEAHEIQSIIRQLEEYHTTKLPEVDVKFSEHAEHSFCIHPTLYDPDGLPYVKKSRISQFESYSLQEDEIQNIDRHKYTIFVATRPDRPRSRVYTDTWHELGHVAAFKLGINDGELNESLATAHEFRGALLAAKEGYFTRDEMDQAIEVHVKGSAAEWHNTHLGIALKRMGLKVAKDLRTAIHHSALTHIKKHNPDLKVRGRDLDQLLSEMDNSLKHIIWTWRKQKYSGYVFILMIVLFFVALFIVLGALRAL